MSQKKRKKKINSRKTYHVFSYETNSSIPVSEQIYHNILNEISKLNQLELDEFLKKSFMNPLFPRRLHSKYQDYSELFNNYTHSYKNINCELIWFQNLFTYNKKSLNKFLILKSKIETSILTSNIDIAIKNIKEIEREVCISFWGIETLSHLKKEFLNEDTSEFISKIKQDSNNNISNFYLQQLLVKSESKEISTFIDNLVDVLQEMRDTEDDESITSFADLASSYFLHYQFDQKRNVNNRRLGHATGYSLIDQYLVFKTYIKEKILFGEGLTNFEKKIVIILSEDINDDELINLITNEPIDLEDIDKDYLEIVKTYTLEDYGEVKKKISKEFNEDSYATSFLEMYARCNIYLEKESEDEFFYQYIAKSLKNILLTKENTIQEIEYLERICEKFRFSNWTIPILFHINRLINEKKDISILSFLEIKLLGRKITPYCLNDFNFKKLIDLLRISPYQLSKSKKIKILNPLEFNDNELSDHFKNIKKHSRLYTDYLIDTSTLLVNKNKLSECVKFISNEYLKNNMYYLVLPIREVLNKLEMTYTNLDIIDLPIICDIYSKKIDSYKDEFYMDKVQDYIDLQEQGYKPSIIFENKKELSNKDIYFLRNICISEIIDVYPEYGCTQNLKRERIKIVDLLILNDQKNAEIYKKEKTKLFDELIFEKLKTDFDSSKIYVDIESLKNKREDEYLRLFNLLLLAKTSDNKKDEYIQLDEKEDVWIPVTDLSSIISKIYSTIFSDFVSNPDFGLDKYLSADIRHGVFIPYIRSSVENCHLLTEESDGIYEKNIYWEEKYTVLIPELREAIDEALKRFSMDFDNLLNIANNWFKINIYIEDENNIPENEGIFDFTKSKDRLSLLQEKLNKDLTFESFFEEIICFMWEITDKATIESRNKINTILKPKMINCIEQLEDDINTIKKSIPLKELLEAISNSKNFVQSDLERTLNWFNSAQDNNNSELYSLASTLNACTDTFKNIANEADIKLTFKKTETDDVTFLTYRETRALMSSIYTALVNSNKYKTEKSIIDLIICENKDNIIITIINEMKLEKDFDKEAFLNPLKEKFSDRYQTLSTSEGGTGLYKIYNFLTNVSNKFTFDIDIIKNNNFCVEIRINK